MKKGKNGQIKLSFGMIFSIILIVIFLLFAFYAIKTFLKIQNTAQVGKFLNDLESDVDRIWKSAESSETKEYDLPSKIEYVCFVDFSSSATGTNSLLYNELKKGYYGDENLIFYPLFSSSNIDSTEIKNIDLEEITKNENPFCIDNIKGEVELSLVKEMDDAQVTITR